LPRPLFIAKAAGPASITVEDLDLWFFDGDGMPLRVPTPVGMATSMTGARRCILQKHMF
jgi:hypothetical protein